VLGFETRTVAALAGPVAPERRSAIEHWVDASLRDMPRHLRAGVAAVSVVLGGWALAARRDPADVVAGLSRSPLPPLRQYQRLFRSLVLFAALETPAGGDPKP
jgi:hypothetical protein